MIVKKISPDLDKPVSGSVRDLLNYIRAAGKNEKLIYDGGRNFLSATDAGQQSEMIALACDATRSRNPVAHYIVSWSEGEIPTRDQIENAVAIFATELGVGECQTVWAAHQNTNNMHVHIVINRVDPATTQVVKINNGFDVEVAHRAIARIETTQKWRREKNARYAIDKSGAAVRTATVDPDKPPVISSRARDRETRTGEASAERICQDVGWPLIHDAANWHEVHVRLAAAGMRYKKKGSGAVVFVDDQPVKASKVNRAATLLSLEKRLGPYDPARAPAARLAKRGPQPIDRRAALYVEQRRAQYAARSAAKAALSQRIDEERRALSATQRAERAALFTDAWRGRGRERNLAQSIIAADHARKRVAMIDRHRAERRAATAEYPRFPDLEDWLRENLSDDDARAHRYRAAAVAEIHGNDDREPLAAQDIRAYRHVPLNNFVYYTNQKGGKAHFVDYGKRVVIINRADGAVLAALQVSEQKFGSKLHLFGDANFIEQAVRIAVENNIAVANPNLQKMIVTERERQRAARAAAAMIITGAGPAERARGGPEFDVLLAFASSLPPARPPGAPGQAPVETPSAAPQPRRPRPR